MQLLHLTRINKSLEVDVIFKAWDFKVSFVWKAIFSGARIVFWKIILSTTYQKIFQN